MLYWAVRTTKPTKTGGLIVTHSQCGGVICKSQNHARSGWWACSEQLWRSIESRPRPHWVLPGRRIDVCRASGIAEGPTRTRSNQRIIKGRIKHIQFTTACGGLGLVGGCGGCAFWAAFGGSGKCKLNVTNLPGLSLDPLLQV